MAMQIHATPDSDGIIRIACGPDVIEIHVQPKVNIVEAGDRAEIVKLPGATGYRRSSGGIKIFDMPIRTMATPGDENFDKLDVDYVIETINFKLGKYSDAELIGLSVGHGTALDIHDLAKLSSSLEEGLPGVGIAVDFGLSGDDE